MFKLKSLETLVVTSLLFTSYLYYRENSIDYSFLNDVNKIQEISNLDRKVIFSSKRRDLPEKFKKKILGTLKKEHKELKRYLDLGKNVDLEIKDVNFKFQVNKNQDENLENFQKYSKQISKYICRHEILNEFKCPKISWNKDLDNSNLKAYVGDYSSDFYRVEIGFANNLNIKDLVFNLNENKLGGRFFNFSNGEKPIVFLGNKNKSQNLKDSQISVLTTPFSEFLGITFEDDFKKYLNGRIPNKRDIRNYESLTESVASYLLLDFFEENSDINISKGEVLFNLENLSKNNLKYKKVIPAFNYLNRNGLENTISLFKKSPGEYFRQINYSK